VECQFASRRPCIELAEDSGGVLPPNLTHEALAKLISSTRETVSKTRGEFADNGLVEFGYRRLSVLDWPRLRQLAGDQETDNAP